MAFSLKKRDQYGFKIHQAKSQSCQSIAMGATKQIIGWTSLRFRCIPAKCGHLSVNTILYCARTIHSRSKFRWP